jgi:hypothetical protein
MEFILMPRGTALLPNISLLATLASGQARLNVEAEFDLIFFFHDCDNNSGEHPGEEDADKEECPKAPLLSSSSSGNEKTWAYPSNKNK